MYFTEVLLWMGVESKMISVRNRVGSGAQSTILDGQSTILDDQSTILDDQSWILDDQNTILDDQSTILS